MKQSRPCFPGAPLRPRSVCTQASREIYLCGLPSTGRFQQGLWTAGCFLGIREFNSAQFSHDSTRRSEGTGRIEGRLWESSYGSFGTGTHDAVFPACTLPLQSGHRTPMMGSMVTSLWPSTSTTPGTRALSRYSTVFLPMAKEQSPTNKKAFCFLQNFSHIKLFFRSISVQK